MRTVLDLILDKHEILLSDAKKTAKEFVLMEDSCAKCIKNKKGYSIKSGRNVYEKGKTKDLAWEKSAEYLYST